MICTEETEKGLYNKEKKEFISSVTNSIFTNASYYKEAIHNFIEKYKKEPIVIVEFVIFTNLQNRSHNLMYKAFNFKKDGDILKHTCKDIMEKNLETLLLKYLKKYNVTDFDLEILKDNFIVVICFFSPDDQYHKAGFKTMLPAYRIITNIMERGSYISLKEHDGLLNKIALEQFFQENLELCVDHYIYVYYSKNN